MNSIDNVFSRMKQIRQKFQYMFPAPGMQSARKPKESVANIPQAKSMTFKDMLNPKFKNEINLASKKYGVPGSLIDAVIKHESNYNKNAISPKGAQGLMQLMPGTADMMDVKNPFAAKDNIFGGTKYLKGLMDRYDGDMVRALAAYNAGPGNVTDKIPPFKETQAYVKNVINTYMKNTGLEK